VGNLFYNSENETTKLNVAKIEKLISTAIAIFASGALMTLLWCVRDLFAKFSDFPEYYAAAHFILHGHAASIYQLASINDMQHMLFPELGQRFIPIYIPPPGLILFTPIALFKPVLALYIWKLLSIAFLIISIVLLVRTFSLKYKQTCYLIAGLSLSHAAFEILRIDQIGSILLFSLSSTLYFLQKKSDIKAGLALSLFILKPQFIVPFLIYLIGLRRWTPVVVFTAVALVLTAISYFILGQSGFNDYLMLVRAPASGLYMQPELMPTLRGQLLRLGSEFSKEISYLSIAVFLAVSFCSWFCGADNRNKEKNILWAFLITIPLSLITSLHCHSYDLILLVPTMIIIFADAVIPFGDRFKLALIMGSLIFLMPLAILIHYFYLLQGGKINVWFIALLIMELFICARLIFKKEFK
jgi:hypothetical protein